ncbi:MAG: cysteine desulfurase [Aliidongia sp.]|nr:cysteine desulfurase [Aliidongia sp.]
MPRSMPIYLDHQATTPTDPSVVAAMIPWFEERFGNPHSTDHEWGWQAEEAIERARRQVAALIGAQPSEIIFTSGATEANNLALLGMAATLKARGRRHIIASPLEHPCVSACLDALAADGFSVTILPIEGSGVIDSLAVERALTPDTGLVTITAASHEIGTVQPLGAIAALCRGAGALLHSDAAQAAGKVPFDVIGIDLVSLSAHKIYGPKGIGALAARGGARRLLRPILRGGGQEGGLRSGTLPVPLAVGFGVAAALASEKMAEEGGRLADLRARLLTGLNAAGLHYEVNGALDRRLPGNLSLRFAGIDAEALIGRVRGRIAVSAGAACASARRVASLGLLAIGLDEAAALATIRIGLGRSTGPAEIDAAVAAFAAACGEAG